MSKTPLCFIIALSVCLLTVSAGLAGCGAVKPTGVPLAGQSRMEQAFNTLIAIDGRLNVKRESWNTYAPALFGMALRTGDLLQLEGSGRATIACADLTLATVPAGISGLPCKVAKPLLTYAGSLVSPTRADQTGDYPIIISPRKTKLLAPRPLIRWTAVAGASSYKVTVRGANVTWSQEVSGTTELTYPENAPALTPGNSYKVSVSAGELSSDQEPMAGLGFTLLAADEAKAVREGEEKIKAMKLPATSTRFLIATLYSTHGLDAEAIELLEELSKSAREPAVLRFLGDLYVRVGLNALALERYSAALELSQKADDIEGQAIASKGLGLVHEAMGRPAEAGKRFQDALALYQKLGDTQAAREVQERLNQLPR